MNGQPGSTSAQNDPSVSIVTSEVSSESINLKHYSQKIQIHSLHPNELASCMNSLNISQQQGRKNNSQCKYEHKDVLSLQRAAYVKCIIEGAYIAFNLPLRFVCRNILRKHFSSVEVNIYRAILYSEAKLGKRGQIGP